MVVINKMDECFSKLFYEEKLLSDNIYLNEYEDFEEIPIYSRYKQIDFLEKYSFNEKNKILIHKALELLDMIELKLKNNHNKCAGDFLLAVTVTDWEDYSYINSLTPHLFISSKKDWMLNLMNLRFNNSIEENIIEEYLSSLRLEGYSVVTTDKAFIDGFCDRVYIMKTPYT